MRRYRLQGDHSGLSCGSMLLVERRGRTVPKVGVSADARGPREQGSLDAAREIQGRHTTSPRISAYGLHPSYTGGGSCHDGITPPVQAHVSSEEAAVCPPGASWLSWTDHDRADPAVGAGGAARQRVSRSRVPPMILKHGLSDDRFPSLAGFKGSEGEFKGSEYLKFPAADQGISVVGISSTLTP